MNIDVSSGAWAAFHHSEDDIHTDVCGAGSTNGVIFFRADADDVEVRSVDKTWNLPAGTTGDITIKVGSTSATFHAEVFGTDALSAQVKPAELEPLMSAMDKAASATVVYGTKTTKTVSLSGSTAALNAFRGCVNNAGFASFAGVSGKASTPF